MCGSAASERVAVDFSLSAEQRNLKEAAAEFARGELNHDLAVPTPDGVKEAKNRRSIITLIP